MGKITGRESREQLPEKVLRLYQAVTELIEEGADISSMKVSEITEKAGIGKGTAYDYFDTKEEIIAYALLFYMEDSLIHLEQAMAEKETIAEQIAYALLIIREQMGKGACMLRFVNLLFDPSPAGIVLREVLQKRKATGQCQHLLFGRRMLEQGIARGELRNDLPISYMTYILITKLVAYLAYVVGSLEEKNGNITPADSFLSGERMPDEEFRRCILEGIREEFEKR